VSGGNPTYHSFSVIERGFEPEKTRLWRAREVRSVRPGQGGTTGQAVDEKDKRKLFDEVFLPHLVPAYRLARWLTGNAADAEDVVQEASLRAFRAIADFGGINARAWALSVVRNTAYTWLLKNRSATMVFTEDLDDAEQQRLERPAAEGEGAVTPESLLLARVDAEEVRGAIAALPAAFREVIVLRELHELSYRDIAEIINAPIGTVMSRLSRARQMLVAALRNMS
jgi:RNA polymerase sigma-70 factor, ECF subfamily